MALAVLGAGVPAAPAQAVQTVGLFLDDSTRAFDGYTLFAPIRSTTTYLIDRSGRLAQSWPAPVTPGLSAYLLEDGRLLRTGVAPNATFNTGGAGGRVQEFDWDGSVVWDYTYSSGQHLQHHDVRWLPGGNVLMVAWELRTQSAAVAAGRNPAYVGAAGLWIDHVIEVEPNGPTSGQIVWEWHAWDHLIQDYDAAKPGYGVVADHPERIDFNFVRSGPSASAADWMHTNAIDYDPELDQILLSIHNLNEVWVIDHGTTSAEATGHTGGRYGRGGDLLYRWGNPRAYRRGTTADQRLFGQHDAQWIRDGLLGAADLLVFNNGTTRGWSSVDQLVTPIDSTGAYSLSPGASFGPAAPTWTYVASPPESFNAQNIGGAQRLPNGNTLVCDGRHGTFFEVASDGATVWTYVNPVVASGPLTQGDSIPSGSSGQENTVFRVYRYGPDYLGLAGRDLTPRGTIEIQPPADVEPQATGNRGSARLDAVAPNPIAGVMRVRFTLPSRGWVRLTLRDVQGRRVRAIFEGESSAGRHEVAEDLQGLAAGVYLVAMEWPGGQSARRVVRVR